MLCGSQRYRKCGVSKIFCWVEREGRRETEAELKVSSTFSHTIGTQKQWSDGAFKFIQRQWKAEMKWLMQTTENIYISILQLKKKKKSGHIIILSPNFLFFIQFSNLCFSPVRNIRKDSLWCPGCETLLLAGHRMHFSLSFWGSGKSGCWKTSDLEVKVGSCCTSNTEGYLCRIFQFRKGLSHNFSKAQAHRELFNTI